ncbi:MAG: hypothetical protein RML32_13725 [Gammaproteobacteria bacterium]|nr:hypothetical protein [Gammaproteobacteria bacterium]
MAEPELTPAERFAQLSRYLDGRLDDAEAARFEQAWALNPGWTTDFELDARLHAGLNVLQAAGQLDAAVRGPWWAQSWRMIALAAGIAAIGVALWLWQAAQQQVAGPLLTAAPGRPLGDSIAVMRLRQAALVEGVVELPAEAQSLELRVMPDAGHAVSGVRYALEIAPLAPEGQPHSAAVDGLVLGADGFVRAYVDSKHLKPGRYRLLLRAAESDLADEFIVDVRARP